MVVKKVKKVKRKTAAEKRFEIFCSEKNLQLAWDRINTYTGDIVSFPIIRAVHN